MLSIGRQGVVPGVGQFKLLIVKCGGQTVEGV